MSVLRVGSPFRQATAAADAPVDTPVGACADVVADTGDGWRLQVDFPEAWCCRIALVPRAGSRQPRSWSVAPSGEVPWSGRDRLSLEGFAACPATLGEDGRTVASETLRVCLAAGVGTDLGLRVERRRGDDWQPFLVDREVAAWRHLHAAGELHHAQARAPDARHYGLGDKSGPLDRTGRRFRCLQLDALGYDAETSDPLYKHVPWLIQSDATGACGLFLDTLAETVFDVGAEHSNYHAPYRVTETRDDSVVLYVIDGPVLADVVGRFAGLSGGSHFLPRRALGFGFTSMHHADAPDAQRVMQDFVAECARRRLPLSALHMGSGYSAGADGRRYVFEWNRARFPGREAFFADLAARGILACANIKPVLLTAHPDFDALAAAGAFVCRRDGAPAIEPFWGGPGAALDFTVEATRDWWTSRVRERLLEPGVGALWNDNNECEIRDEDRVFAGDGAPLPALDARPLQALLMTRTSFEALAAKHPEERPYTITRAGPVGLARYAQTWTGDNRTSWHTLRWNLPNALSMSLSGLPHVGHDIGGFDGPSPDAELLLRWFEMMALHPRAVMNSWKQDGGIATTPWLHEAVVERVRAVLELRYRLLPELHHLNRLAHEHGQPILRPLCLAFEEDAACRDEMSAFLCGEHLLVAPVVEPGATTRTLRLPMAAGGWHHWDGAVESAATHHPGGVEVTVAAPPGTLPLFVRDGAVLALATAWPDDAPHDASDVRLRVFAAADGRSTRVLTFEDGRSHAWRHGDASRLGIRCERDAGEVRLEVVEHESGRGRPTLGAVLDAGDARTLRFTPPG